MEPEKLQKVIDATLPNENVPYVFAAFDPATGRMIMVRRGDLGICTTMQMHIAAHIVQQMAELAPPVSPEAANLAAALREVGKEDPLMRPASGN